MLEDVANFLSCDNGYRDSKGKCPYSWETPAKFSGEMSVAYLPMALRAHTHREKANMTARTVK